MSYCPDCGNKIDDDGLCPSCKNKTEKEKVTENYQNQNLKKKKSFAPKLFIILIASACILYVSYPFIAAKNPDIRHTVDNLRGHYSGPLFIDNQGQGTWIGSRYNSAEFKLDENGKKYFFRSASDQRYGFFLKTGLSRFNISEINLYELKSGKQISSNKNFAFESGRKATATMAQGKDLPEHGNYLEAKLEKGKDYFLEILPKSNDQIGKNARLNIYINQDELSLETILGSVIGLIVGIYILFYFLKAVIFIRKNR